MAVRPRPHATGAVEGARDRLWATRWLRAGAARRRASGSRGGPAGPRSTRLHHVSDLDQVLDGIAAVLAPGGAVVVVEWAWERVDEPTARWCFAQLDTDAEPSWLTQRRDEWQASGRPWGAYFTGWARDQGLHRSDAIQRALDQRFHRLLSAAGPYYFSDLHDTTEADEQAAIDAGAIRPTCIKYVGTLGLDFHRAEVPAIIGQVNEGDPVPGA